MKKKEKQDPIAKLEKPYLIKAARSRTEWRELGLHFQVYFRLEKDGSFEICGKVSDKQEIETLCKALSKCLAGELAVQRRLEKEYKACWMDLGQSA